MKKTFMLFTALTCASFYAQFTSPGTGITYNLSSLAVAAPGTVINNTSDFQFLKDVTISKGDKLIIDENTTVKMNKDVTLFINGEYKSNMNNLLITASVVGEPYKGIRFDDDAVVNIKNTTIERGGGIRVNSSNFIMDNCIVRYNVSGLVTGGAIVFGGGISPIVKNSQFIENDLPALASGANIIVSATFDNNYFYGNNKSNGNRPQINMGPGGTAGINIINNTIIGDRSLTMTGGLAVAALFADPNKFVIENNIIKDNRYGITISGATSKGILSKNTIENNNTQNNPSLGGSGINFTGSGTTYTMDVKVSENIVRGNLWGVTLQGTSQANFGSDQVGKENIGKNIFKNNGNGGTISALYNNTPNNLEAKFNCWREGELSTLAMVKEVITDKVNNPSYGTVNYTPFDCAENMAVNDIKNLKSSIYPNPSNGQFTLDTEKSGNIVVTDLSGKLVHSSIVEKGKNQLKLNLQSGTYILLYQSEGQKSTSKIIIK